MESRYLISCMPLSHSSPFYERPNRKLDLHDGEYFDQQARKAAREATWTAALWLIGLTAVGIGLWMQFRGG